MKIGFIGAGRVATHLAQTLSKQHQITWVYSRQTQSASQLAVTVYAHAIDGLAEAIHDVDLIFIAVNDQQIPVVAQQLAQLQCKTLVVHTSGSTHLSVLAAQGLRCGVFYPLQTFSIGRQIDWQSTPLFIEAAIAEDQLILQQLATSLSQRVYAYSSAQRLSLHLAAVFACNFSNYCYDMAKQVVDRHQVDFSLLYPLILETAQKATQHDPHLMQTGPAMRGDEKILNMHVGLLSDAEQAHLAEVYAMLSRQIMQSHHS